MESSSNESLAVEIPVFHTSILTATILAVNSVDFLVFEFFKSEILRLLKLKRYLQESISSSIRFQELRQSLNIVMKILIKKTT